MSERAFITRATPEVLAAVLQLPPGAYIDHIAADPLMPGVIQLRVRGAGPEVKVGERLQERIGKIFSRDAVPGDKIDQIEWVTP